MCVREIQLFVLLLLSTRILLQTTGLLRKTTAAGIFSLQDDLIFTLADDVVVATAGVEQLVGEICLALYHTLVRHQVVDIFFHLSVNCKGRKVS